MNSASILTKNICQPDYTMSLNSKKGVLSQPSDYGLPLWSPAWFTNPVRIDQQIRQMKDGADMYRERDTENLQVQRIVQIRWPCGSGLSQVSPTS